MRGFGFNNLTIYTTNGNLAATGYQWDPNKNRTGGSGTWDASTTANFYNGSADNNVEYNATLGDTTTFGATTAGTVTVASAGVTASNLIFNTPGYVITGSTITMMGNQTINATSGNATINSAIAGTSGLTVTGAGSVTLGGTNTFTNGMFVTGGGTAAFALDANLGAAGQPITLDNGTLNYTGTTTPTFTRVINIGPGGGTIDTVNNAGTGKIVISGPFRFIQRFRQRDQIRPRLAFTMAGSNSGVFTGNWIVSGGAMEVDSPTSVGNGSMTVNSGGELAVANGQVLPNPIIMAGGIFGADNNTGTFTGPVSVTSNSSLRLGNFWNGTSQSTNLTGNISGAGSLTTLGAFGTTSSTGQLKLTGNNSAFSGGFVIPVGTVVAGLFFHQPASAPRPITPSGGKASLQGRLTPGGTSPISAISLTGFNKDEIFGSPDHQARFSTPYRRPDNVFGYFQTGYTPQFNPTVTVLNQYTALTGGISGQNLTAAGTKHTLLPAIFHGEQRAAGSWQGSARNSLTLATPTAYANLAILAASTNAADDTPNVTINFTDGTSVTTTYKAYDWSIGTDPLRQAADIFGATGVNRYSPTQSPGWDQRAFGMYETDLNLTNIGGIDYSTKLISSVTSSARSPRPAD